MQNALLDVIMPCIDDPNRVQFNAWFDALLEFDVVTKQSDLQRSWKLSLVRGW